MQLRNTPKITTHSVKKHVERAGSGYKDWVSRVWKEADDMIIQKARVAPCNINWIAHHAAAHRSILGVHLAVQIRHSVCKMRQIAKKKAAL
jgi:hypothetical protein